MFESLKKKLSSLFTKKEEPKKKTSKKKTEKPVKTVKSSKQKEKKQKIPKKEKKVVKEDFKEEIKGDIQKAEIKEHLIKEEIKEEKQQEEPQEEKQGFFSKIFKKISSSGTITIEQSNVDEIFQEIEITLLENNVALEVVDKIRANLHKDLVGVEVKKDKIEETILNSLKNSILEVLIEPPNLIEEIKKHDLGPYVILFFGINGSGKTTSIAKLAHKLKQNNISLVLAAGDTFRAASIEQLQTHAKKLNVPVISSSYGSDPASVAFDAIKYAEKNKIQCVLIDTAGRMYTKSNLLKEMEKIIRISKPNLKIFVGESITGNDATEQAKTFNETAGIDGIILSKADVDEKAGTILSVSYVTGKPIYFLGTGQEYKDLTDFKKADVIKHLGL